MKLMPGLTATIPNAPNSGEDPFAERSSYRRSWEDEEKRRAAAMRNAGICLVGNIGVKSRS
jgi:hypothetical protein